MKRIKRILVVVLAMAIVLQHSFIDMHGYIVEAVSSKDTYIISSTRDTLEDKCPTVHIEAEDFVSQNGVEIASKMYEDSQFINSIGYGDSVTYGIELLGTGNYTIGVRASTTYTGGIRAMKVYIDGKYITNVEISNTGAWAVFNTFLSEVIYLEKGTHTVTFEAVLGGFNVNWIEFIGSESKDGSEAGEDKDVTIHIEAEDYDSMSGVELRGIYDQGTDVLKSVDAGDYMLYTVDVEKAGKYTFKVRAARADSGSSVLSFMENDKVIATADITGTGGWACFSEFTGTEMTLTAGIHTFKVYANGGRYNLNWFEIVQEAGGEESTQAPEVSDIIHIEAEQYTSMSGIALRGTYDQGTDVLSSVDAGDYMIYTVNVPVTGTYRFDVRAARVDADTSVLSLMENSSVIATVNVGTTGGWTMFSEFNGTEVYLTTGIHTFKVYANGGRYNLNWFELVYQAETDTETPTEGSSEIPVEGENIHIEAEEYTSMSGVTLRGVYDQGTDVLNSVDAGDYMIYTINVPISGIYRFDVRAARSDHNLSKLSLMENDSVIATVNVDQTGGWSNFAEFSGTKTRLAAGPHTFKVYADGGRYNLNWFELTYISDGKAPTGYSNPNVAIVGDSYSTFDGYLVSGNVPYYPASDNNVTTAEDTWWYKVIGGIDGSLLINESSSGSSVSNTEHYSKPHLSFINRLKRSDSIGETNTTGVKPDIIFLMGGLNDSNAAIGDYIYAGWTEEDLLKFAPSYAYVINYLKTWNPDAKIYAITPRYMGEPYKKAIATVCEYYGIDNIETSGYGMVNGHPTASGMTAIANSILDYIYISK